MADTAEQRLRGILARDHNTATIDALLDQVRAEWSAQPKDSPRALTSLERGYTDVSTYAYQARLCLACPYETSPWDDAIDADDQIRDHLSEVHSA